MKSFASFGRPLAAAVLLCAAGAPAAVTAADPAPAVTELEGLWEARAAYGPALRGRLVVDRTAAGWSADLMGRRIEGRVEGDSVHFDFGNGGGLRLVLKHRGRDREGLHGWWTQSQGPFDAYRFATPVDFAREAAGRWSGLVEPRDDVLSLFMPVKVGTDGKAAAWIRNPERNAGRFLSIGRVEMAGGEVRLIGKPFGAKEDEVVGRGTFDADNDILSVHVQRVGQSYEFHRVLPGQPSAFFARGSGSVPYRYAAPPARADDWPVGSLEGAGISREGMERFIQSLIDLPRESNSTPEVHAVLVARRGKLVLEEYFHGMDRDQLHDTRSAGKSVVSVLFGAAMQAGYRLDPQMRVYETLGYPADDPRKAAMTAEQLMLQTSGFHCDDDDSAAPGNEDGMLDQRAQKDWYKFSLDVPLITAPGSAAPVYCSMQPNLLGAVIGRATGRPIEDVFRDHVAEPMGIRRYALNVQPTGEPYHGGGLYLQPRDFAKFAQVMMDGGTWQGRRVVSRAYAERSTAPIEAFGRRRYGYLWWSQTYPYRGREVRAYYAAGNGGQIAMAIPELELVICFMGGNYSDPALFIPQNRYVPEAILPAVN